MPKIIKKDIVGLEIEKELKEKYGHDEIHCIYKITNKINGKVYIGRSKNLLPRWHTHRHAGGENPHLHNSIKKHGKNNFSIEILLFCSERDVVFYESCCINTYHSANPLVGYNLTDGTEIGTIRVSASTRRKTSESVKKALIKNGHHLAKCIYAFGFIYPSLRFFSRERSIPYTTACHMSERKEIWFLSDPNATVQEEINRKHFELNGPKICGKRVSVYGEEFGNIKIAGKLSKINRGTIFKKLKDDPENVFYI